MKILFPMLMLLFTQCTPLLQSKNHNVSFKTTHGFKGAYNQSDSIVIESTEWIIKNDTFNYYSPKFKTKLSRYDVNTLYFKNHRYSNYIPIIFKTPKEDNYIFTHNPCCGNFNSGNKSTYSFKSNVFLKINDCTEGSYKLLHGEQLFELTCNKYIFIENTDHGAMSSNIFPFRIFKSTDNIDDIEEIFNNNPVSFRYMPLSNDTIYIIYDMKTKEISISHKK